MRFTGSKVLITGGSSGIGFATARLMVAEGAKVAITGRDEGRLAQAARELGGDVLAIQGDLSEGDTITRTMTRVSQAFGTLDVLFANAGISGQTPAGQTSIETFESIVRTNFIAVFATIQQALLLMSHGGAIILNGSIMRAAGMPGTSAYAGSKAAVSSMARVLAAELAPRGIRVNTVVPGGTRTAIWTRGARAGMTVEAAEQRLTPVIPLDRFAEAEEVANAVLFLASREASAMTAAEIVVDGGMSGAPFASMGQKPAASAPRPTPSDPQPAART
jgi:NAD(P)-dependent dehydrogenase (short-subunit alcohol dehydrogenase family)